MCETYETVITMVYHPVSDTFDIWMTTRQPNDDTDLAAAVLDANPSIVKKFHYLRRVLWNEYSNSSIRTPIADPPD